MQGRLLFLGVTPLQTERPRQQCRTVPPHRSRAWQEQGEKTLFQDQYICVTFLVLLFCLIVVIPVITGVPATAKNLLGVSLICFSCMLTHYTSWSWAGAVVSFQRGTRVPLQQGGKMLPSTVFVQNVQKASHECIAAKNWSFMVRHVKTPQHC